MLTIEEFHAVLEDPDYHAMPKEMVKNNDPSEKWREGFHQYNAACAKMQIWELATQVAILFEKYPGLVKEVNLTFAESLQGGLDYDFPAFFVNNCQAYGDDTDLERFEDVGEAIFDVDRGEVFGEVAAGANDIIPWVLGGDVAAFDKVFGKTLTSSQQVLDLAKSALGDVGFKIEALIAKKTLEKQRSAEVEKLESENNTCKHSLTGGEYKSQERPGKAQRL